MQRLDRRARVLNLDYLVENRSILISNSEKLASLSFSHFGVNNFCCSWEFTQPSLSIVLSRAQFLLLSSVSYVVLVLLRCEQRGPN